MKVAFFKGKHPGWKGWLGVLTKWWTCGPYSHCELVFGTQASTGLSTCWSSTWLDKGVRCAQIVLDPAMWDVIDVPTTAEQDAAALAWFKANEGAPYDTLALFGFLFRPLKGVGNRYFCDEACLEAMGFPEAWRYDPNSAYQLLLGVAGLLEANVKCGMVPHQLAPLESV